jgi:DNA-binding transcriptional LysR family regulator
MEAPITKINLKLLQSFMLVAEHNSFRVAADLTHRSNSAVSSQIKQLELQLGIALLHRTTRSVHLTTAGEKLLATTRRALHEVHLGLQELYEEADAERGQVSIACSPSLSPVYLPAILTKFEEAHPGVRVVVRELPSRELFPSVRCGDFDFAVGSRGASISNVDFETVIEDEFLAIAPPDFLPDATSTVSLATLATVPVLLPAASTASRQMLEDAARTQGVKLVPKHECVHQGTLVSMAEAGLGVGVLRRSIAYSNAKRAMRALRIVDPVISRSVGIIKIRGQCLSAPAERLAQLFVEFLPRFLTGDDKDWIRPPAVRRAPIAG